MGQACKWGSARAVPLCLCLAVTIIDPMTGSQYIYIYILLILCFFPDLRRPLSVRVLHVYVVLFAVTHFPCNHHTMADRRDSNEECPPTPHNQPNPIKNDTVSNPDKAYMALPRKPSALGFFPMPVQRALPPEIRGMIYNYVASLNIKVVSNRILPHRGLCIRSFEGVIWYEDTSCALALLRNGHVWENDASSSLALSRATKAFTLLASYTQLTHPTWCPNSLGNHRRKLIHHLHSLLKAIDVVYAMDMEQQRPSTAFRSWTAPLQDTVLRTGVSVLRSIVPQLPPMESHLLRKSHPTAEKFLQTLILQLRRNPEINIRIMLPEGLTKSELRLYPELARDGLEKAVEALCEANAKALKAFIRQIQRGMSLTRLPRPRTSYIRHRFTLVFLEPSEEQASYWKDRFKGFEWEIEWDTATQDEMTAIFGKC